MLIRPTVECKDNIERMLQLARDSAGYHVLIIHCDADYPTSERARRERFDPGLQRIQVAREAGEKVCECVVPIIPVQMIEAWMIADTHTLHGIIGTRASVEELGLPRQPHQVESIDKPKQTLLEAIKRALADRPRRRRDPQQVLKTMPELLARQIQLEELRKVPAFAAFEGELTKALRALHLLA